MADITTQLQTEFANVKMSALFDALTAQRNNALNEVANLVAENAMLKAALERQTQKQTELEASRRSNFDT